ncbi:hypothetical protein BO70DRAFT_428016 [Aspergillus heteromorphus CBS 117.55]|uniref:Serine hydrolase domain-containing protein n=1 Tax=Aspergillus heteromorphus CBS 117.55 TaxID=1448321 RepID=A0A317WKS9_9EURO|nr:uncharacterized protein BO70DRAFT_428016 [Aspergillus heteromorphus CBS 117.55]PWY85902.1 hypothetical protein BO70DRAFT_428016 [Aspergillus heteromorphus CBS 117.55]
MADAPPISLDQLQTQQDADDGPGSQETDNRANILMLHGHGQSVGIFHPKTGFLQDALNAAASPCPDRVLPRFTFYYCEAPFEVSPELGSRAWGFGMFDTQPIQGLQRSVELVLRQLERINPVVGIVGFSTGATLAMVIAALLEKKERCGLFGLTTSHPPLKFVLSYSGFMLGHREYRDLYYPRIRTPVLHHIAELDIMIPARMTRRLAARCSKAQVRTSFATHHVPRQPETTRAAVEFVVQLRNLTLRIIVGLAGSGMPP